jgi:hypothetical protein
MYSVSASTPRQLAYELLSVCDEDPVKLHARPWNYHDPDASLWWLVPTPDWPAYEHGKLICDWRNEHFGDLSCGIYVEKGLGSEARPAYRTAKARSLFMDSDWRWESFVAALASGTFAAEVAALEGNLSATWEIRIDCGAVPDKDDFDPHSSGYRDASSRYRWSWTPGQHALQPMSVADPQRIASTLKKAESITDLANLLNAIPRDQWLWIDVMIGLPLIKSADGTTPDFRSAQQLWNWHLRSLASWL